MREGKKTSPDFPRISALVGSGQSKRSPKRNKFFHPFLMTLLHWVITNLLCHLESPVSSVLVTPFYYIGLWCLLHPGCRQEHWTPVDSAVLNSKFSLVLMLITFKTTHACHHINSKCKQTNNYPIPADNLATPNACTPYYFLIVTATSDVRLGSPRLTAPLALPPAIVYVQPA